MNKTTLYAGILVLILPISDPLFSASPDNWYSEDQLTQGEELFETSCQNCHGINAIGTQNWKAKDASDNLPPPPLNGTAHTWHHSPSILLRTISEGGQELGGTMPGFKDQLDTEQMVSLIAYLNSLWPEEIYKSWLKKFPEVQKLGITENAAQVLSKSDSSSSSNDSSDNGIPESVVVSLLKKLLPPSEVVGSPEETPIDGVFSVEALGRFFYIHEEGRYAFVGDLIDLSTSKNLTESSRAAARLNNIFRFKDEDKVIFAAVESEKGTLDIFTDTTCPYCKKLHLEVPKLQAAGVTVRYLPFPRSGAQGQGYDEMRTVWCAKNSQESMTIAKSQTGIELGEMNCDRAAAVLAGYQLGKQIGVKGTPAIILPDGTMVPGYQSYSELLKLLKIEEK